MAARRDGLANTGTRGRVRIRPLNNGHCSAVGREFGAALNHLHFVCSIGADEEDERTS